MNQIDAIKQEQIRRQCLGSFWEFTRYAWPVVDPSSFLPAWHIRVLCHYLQSLHERRIRNLIVNMPPGHGKSLIASVMFPAWVWAKSPEQIFLCAAHVDKLATRDSVRCRDLIKSNWFQSTFKPSWAIKHDQDEKTYYVNTAHGGRWSTGVTSKVTGARSNYTIIDDPSDAQRGVTPNALREVIDWHDQKMVSRRLDATFGEIVIMQRLHDGDLVGHILKHYGSAYSHLVLQAEYDPTAIPKSANILFKDPRKPGELLFPNLYGEEKMIHLKLALGSYGASAQLQQSPRVRTGGYFKASMFPRYRYSQFQTEDFDYAFSSWDCSVEGAAHNDPVAGQIWCRVRKSHPTYPGRFVLWDALTANADMSATLRIIKGLHIKHPFVYSKLIEKKANGAPIIQLLQNELGDSNVIPFEPGSRSKEIRAAVVTPACEAGMVLIPEDSEAPWVVDWLHELEAFPKGEHDDQVDATTQALLHLTQSKEWVFAF